MMSFSDDKQADFIDAFNTTSRCFDDILNINNIYFDKTASHIYPSDLHLNKAKTSDTEAAFKACIYQFLMILFLPKFMISETTLTWCFGCLSGPPGFTCWIFLLQ